jgi:hypothetical protein
MLPSSFDSQVRYHEIIEQRYYKFQSKNHISGKVSFLKSALTISRQLRISIYVFLDLYL